MNKNGDEKGMTNEYIIFLDVKLFFFSLKEYTWTCGRGLWERIMGEDCGRGLWERIMGEDCGRGLWYGV